MGRRSTADRWSALGEAGSGEPAALQCSGQAKSEQSLGPVVTAGMEGVGDGGRRFEVPARGKLWWYSGEGSGAALAPGTNDTIRDRVEAGQSLKQQHFPGLTFRVLGSLCR